MNNYRSEYNSKLIKKEQILKLLKKGDRLMCHGGEVSILSFLDENIDALPGIDVYTIFNLTRPYGFLDNTHKDKLYHYAGWSTPPVRKAMEDGYAPEVIITHFSDIDDYVRVRVKPNILVCQATPMDEDGFFTMGYNSLGHRAGIEIADRVVVQVNSKLPRINGDCNKVHISEVAAIYEEDTALHTATPEVHSATDYKAASFIAERIPNEATIQFGVGRVPDTIGEQLTNHRNLGVHTELFSQSMMELMKSGVVTNTHKTLMPGKSMFAFAGGMRATQEIYDFVDGNENIEMRTVSWVNDPRVIAQNDKFISVNAALAIDLTGQVCSETLGIKPYSGCGGQLDFVRGAKWSKGGQSFIVINSIVEKKDGTKISKIDLTLPLGSTVTTPRADVDMIVTEYGVAELRYKSLAERAKALIAIAHPDFRDELTFKAKKTGYFI